MFWEVWRNVVTTNFGLGGGNANKKGRSSSKSAKRSCYDRLISSPIRSGAGSGGPKKSVSQPVSLVHFTKDDMFGDDEEEDNKLSVIPTIMESSSHNAPVSENKQINSKAKAASASGTGGAGARGGSGVKRSLSSFFPFSSCATYGGASASAVKSQSSVDDNQQDPEDENKNESDTIKRGDKDNPVNDFEDHFSDQVVTPASPPKSKDTTNLNEIADNDHIIDYWDENMELPSCDVCAKSFPTIRQLAAHQRRKRHYGCIECDSIFPSREILECHREQMCHYEFAIDLYAIDEADLDDEADFFESDDDDENFRLSDEDQEDCDDEEMERLL